MPRTIWKGSISFGLVNIPVALLPGEQREELHFALLERPVENMAAEWDPTEYKDEYREDLMRVAEEKVAAGKTLESERPTKEKSAGGARVIDFMTLLKRSIDEKEKGRPTTEKETGHAARRVGGAKTPRRHTAAHLNGHDANNQSDRSMATQKANEVTAPPPRHGIRRLPA